MTRCSATASPATLTETAGRCRYLERPLRNRARILFATVAYPSLNAFLHTLEKAGELRRIPFPVATELEITEIADREMKSPGGGKALLFEQPTIDGTPSRFPLAINTMGSAKRMAHALGIESVDDLAHQMQLILKAKPPTNLRQGWDLLKQGVNLLHARPKKVKDGPCKEVVTRFDKAGTSSSDGGVTLNDLPILKCWPRGRRAFRHAAQRVHEATPTPASATWACTGCRSTTAQTTGMHWQVHKVGARHGKPLL